MKKRAIDMEISVNLIRYRHCEWGASCKCHWETGKAGYAGAGAMLPIREPEDLQKEKHFAIF